MRLAVAFLKHKVDEPAALHPVKGAVGVSARLCPGSPFLLPALPQVSVLPWLRPPSCL